MFLCVSELTDGLQDVVLRKKLIIKVKKTRPVNEYP
jgi:hypothetical protein